MTVHVVPTDDTYPHTESLDCACGPQIEQEDDSDMLVIHNAWDDRDLEEDPAAWERMP